MIADMLDWSGVAMGLAFGLGAGGLFFWGLAVGIRAALVAARPGPVLMAGAGLRIGLLLLAGWGAASLGVAQGLGFAAGFVAARTIALAWAR
jgi:hypothetical protein